MNSSRKHYTELKQNEYYIDETVDHKCRCIGDINVSIYFVQ